MWDETINEEMGLTIMHLCRAEDYGELHRLLIGRVAWIDGLDEGNSLLHDVASILKMAKDEFPNYKDFSDGCYGDYGQRGAYCGAIEEWFNKWFAVYTKG